MHECQPTTAHAGQRNQDSLRARHLTRPTRLIAIAFALVSALAIAAMPAVGSQLTTQTFTLQPGWNAIYLEVEPLDANAMPVDAEAVFDSLPAGLPLESAWTWYGRTSTVQFIENPNEQRLREVGWLGYFPRPGPDAFLTNLHRVEANRAYLLKLGGNQPAQWSVTGRPRFTRPRWVPGSFNLVGMPVDPSAPPTFTAFFDASAAHTGQPIYRLEPGGTWRLAGAGEAMASGEAFWIYTVSASDFSGPLHLDLLGNGIDFDNQLDTIKIALTNRANVGRTVQARLLTSGPIAYQDFDPGQGRFVWQPLSATADLTIAPGQRVALHLAPIRRDFGTDFESILELRDGAGSRRLLPVRALAVGAVALPEGAIRGMPCAYGGLWVGTATIDQVSQVPGSTGTGPPPLAETVSSSFAQRLLIHVGGVDHDGGCVPRLIDEVYQMWLPDGDKGCFALVTDRALLTPEAPEGLYLGSTLADGEAVGRRMSTVAYHLDSDLDPDPDSGGFGDPGSPLKATIRIAGDHRTHPYRHRYHPRSRASDQRLRNAVFRYRQTGGLHGRLGYLPQRRPSRLWLRRTVPRRRYRR